MRLLVLLAACTATPPKHPVGTPILFLEREPYLQCREGRVALNAASHVKIAFGKTTVPAAYKDAIGMEVTSDEPWVCILGNADFTYGLLKDGVVEAGPNVYGKRETLKDAKTHAVPKAWAEEFKQAHAGMLLREQAVKAKPAKPKDWEPQTNEYVLWREHPWLPWEAYNVLWDTPVVQGVVRELWQPRNVQVLNKAKVEDVYPFPDPEERPRIEQDDFVMCIVIDANMASHRSSHLGKVLRRSNELLTVQDESGGSRKVHSSDCLKLQL